jgi:hypothetical protein
MDQAKVKRLDDFLSSHGISTRDKWGARATKIEDKPENLDWDYNTVVIHHSGRSGETDPVAIQKKHMDKNGWDDVGYHFMVAPGGTIYEGRRLVYKGSHTELANTKKIGILVMGNFHKEFWGLFGNTPTASHLQVVNKLVNWLKELFPTLECLGGHQDWKATECPGSELYAKLGDIRTATALGGPMCIP